MDRAALYEQLVGLCESYSPDARDSFETMFAIVDAERKIGTVEAQLIVSAFMSRVRLQKAHRELAEAFKRADKQAAEEEWSEAVRRKGQKAESVAEVAF